MALVSPSDPQADYFSVFELKPSFAVDGSDLERRFYQLAKSLHPDRFANHPDPIQKSQAIEKMSLVNQAYQTLKSPDLRREYLMEYFKIPKLKPQIPVDLAEQWFEVQEEPGSRAFIDFGNQLSKRDLDLRLSIKKLENEFDQSANPEALVQISALIQDLAYLQSLGRDYDRKSEMKNQGGHHG